MGRYDDDDDDGFWRTVRRLGLIVGLAGGVIGLLVQFGNLKSHPPSQEQVPVVVNQTPPSPEEQLWTETERANALLAYQHYLEQFPEGLHVGVAQARIMEIQQQDQQRGIFDACTVFVHNNPERRNGGGFLSSVVGPVLACGAAAASNGSCNVNIGERRQPDFGIPSPREDRERAEADQRQAQRIDDCVRAGGPSGMPQDPR